MKKLLLIALTAIMMVGCSISVEDDAKYCEENYHVIIYDSCEYLSHKTRISGGITHKGNCRFCAERRRAEIREIVELLKDK